MEYGWVIVKCVFVLFFKMLEILENSFFLCSYLADQEDPELPGEGWSGSLGKIAEEETVV